MAIAPDYYRDARLTAQYHVAGYITRRMGDRCRVFVYRVFRGPMWPGRLLELQLYFPSERPSLGEPLGTNVKAYFENDFCEAFLDGDPPRLTREQIKFFKWPILFASRNIDARSYSW